MANALGYDRCRQHQTSEYKKALSRPAKRIAESHAHEYGVANSYVDKECNGNAKDNCQDRRNAG